MRLQPMRNTTWAMPTITLSRLNSSNSLYRRRPAMLPTIIIITSI